MVRKWPFCNLPLNTIVPQYTTGVTCEAGTWAQDLHVSITFSGILYCELSYSMVDCGLILWKWVATAGLYFFFRRVRQFVRLWTLFTPNWCWFHLVTILNSAHSAGSLRHWVRPFIKFRVIHLRIVEPMYVISGIPKAMCFYFFKFVKTGK